MHFITKATPIIINLASIELLCKLTKQLDIFPYLKS